jgi:Holliday junction resolvase RusA-like endonuclease
MTRSIDRVVHGVPAPQGSKRGGVSAKTGKSFGYEQDSKTQKSWRQDVIAAAVALREAGDFETLDGPIELQVEFRLPRPASVNIRRRPHPCVKPDMDKLLRNTLDGLTQAGIYRDDAQVINLWSAKRYATDDPNGSPGATIRVALVALPEII